MRYSEKRIVIVALVVIAAIAGMYLWNRSDPAQNGATEEDREEVRLEGIETACTREAFVCPDGSTVSRTGPNCEFVPCPGTP